MDAKRPIQIQKSREYVYWICKYEWHELDIWKYT